MDHQSRIPHLLSIVDGFVCVWQLAFWQMDRFMWQLFVLYLGRVNRAGFSGTGMWWRTFVASPKIQRALSLRALEFLVCYQTLIFKYWGFWLYKWAAKNKLMTCLKLIGDLVHNWTYDCKPLFCIVALWSKVGKKFNHLQNIWLVKSAALQAWHRFRYCC